MNQSPVLCWFRRDLRLHDHAALYHALKSGHPVIPVFIFDTDILDHLPRADRRVEFIHGCIGELKRALQTRGADLLVRIGSARALIPQLARQLGAHTV